MRGWQRIGDVDPSELTETRLSAHWATQVVASVARALIAPQPGDSHTNLHWSSEYRALVGNGMSSGTRVGLRLSDFSIVVLTTGGDIVDAFPLHGRTLADAYDWAHGALHDRLSIDFDLIRPDYEMPEHPLQDGAPFVRPASEPLSELVRWFGNADFALKSFAQAEPRATPIAVWPHHFDAGGIVYLEDAVGSSPQIGFGLSPGDDTYDEPYLYVTPWPLSAESRPAPLSSGCWRTEGFSGAVLTGSEIARLVDRQDQYGLVERFLREAVGAGESAIAVP